MRKKKKQWSGTRAAQESHKGSERDRAPQFGIQLGKCGRQQLKLSLLLSPHLSECRSHLQQMIAIQMLHGIIFMTGAVGVQSLLLPSLTLLPILELTINIYDSIWIMWSEMTKYHLERWTVEIAGRLRTGNNRVGRHIQNFDMSRRGIDLQRRRWCKLIMRGVLITLCSLREEEMDSYWWPLLHYVILSPMFLHISN